MGCGSSRIGDELDAIRDAVVTGAGVAAYVVTGAGSAAVNGVYFRDGMHDGYPCFRNGQIWLCKNGDEWCLSDKDRLGSDRGDYYSLRMSNDDALPANFGWETCSAGALPLPTIQLVPEGPAAVKVDGAGSEQANGVYRRNGTYDGAPRYTRDGGTLCIYRSRANGYKWMIANKESDADIAEGAGDLYESAVASEYPPQSKFTWHAAEDGAEPAPSVEALDSSGCRLMPGWVQVDAHPAYVAQATFVSAQTVPAGGEQPAVAVAVPL